MNIYEGLTFVPSLFGTHLMVIFSDTFFNTTILIQTALPVSFVFLFLFLFLCDIAIEQKSRKMDYLPF